MSKSSDPKAAPHRRDVLWLCGSVPAAAAVAGVSSLSAAQADIVSVQCLFRKPEDAAQVGRAVRALVPEAELDRPLSLPGFKDTPSGRQALAQHVSDEIRADFEAGRVVTVDGWVLSKTEAQICAHLSTHC